MPYKHEIPTRIVWVTFDFPPRQSSGVFRPIKIYKYLDKRAFDVDFVTHGAAPRFKDAVLDHSLLAEVSPQPRIYRVATLILHDLLPSLAARLRGRRKAVARDAAKAAPASSAGDDQRRRPSPRRSGLGGTLYRWFAIAAYFPDHLFIWGWSAALKTLWLHLRRRYDVIYTTSYPESAHLAGLLMGALGVKWVADYRYGGPLWIKEVVGYRKPSIREFLDHQYQRLVLRRADFVITQSENIRHDFCRVFDLDPARVQVIPSGYDEADFERLDPATAPFARRPGEVHLLHLGNLEGVAVRDRRRMADALNELEHQLRNRGRSLVCHALGSDLFADEHRRTALAFDYRHHGVIVHRQVPSYLLASDCYLLSTMTSSNHDVKGFIPSKLWEYLRAGRPILTAGPKDEVWTIVDDAGVAIDLPLHDGRSQAMNDVAQLLLARIGQKRSIDARVTRHSWASRAQSVQDVFEHVAPTTSRPRREEAVA